MGKWFTKFGAKKTVSFTPQDLIDEIAQPSNPAYAAWYLRPAGAAAARQLALDCYDKHARPGVKFENLVNAVNDLLRRDNIKYRENMRMLPIFSARAARGHYSTGLAIKGNHALGDNFVPGQRRSEYDRAADWVVKCSDTLNGSGSDSKGWKDLRRAIEHVVLNMDVTSVAALEHLHAAAGRVNAEARIASMPGDFYGTSALGQMTLPDVFGMARALRPQTLGRGVRGGATDLGMFLMLGCIRAHPFGDGNGRSSRALYACTQIKFGDRFVPMDYRWGQNQLHDRNIHAVVNPVIPTYNRRVLQPAATRQVGSGFHPSMVTVPLPRPADAEPQRDARGRVVYEFGEPELI